jgi:hypothetical protein
VNLINYKVCVSCCQWLLIQWIVFGSELVLKVAKTYKRIIPLFMQLSSGFGNLVVNPSTKCSFSFFCIIVWTLGSCYKGMIFFMATYSCELCNGAHLELRNHLFFTCPFAICCWNYIYPAWQSPVLNGNNAPILGFSDSIKRTISQPFSLKIIMLVCWAIWTTRNNFIFKDITLSIYT